MRNNLLLGAIAGDIIGSIYEFNSTKNYDFLLISDSSTYTDKYNVLEWKENQ